MNRYYKALEEIAYDLTWIWDHKADILWKELNPELWALTRNPLVILQTISPEKLKLVLSHPYFHQIIFDLQTNAIAFENREDLWFQKKYPKTPLSKLAFFSMEYMLSESLPIYSGGLGNVAGDQLKAMNDLGVPVVGIGLLYQQGYFRQVIDKDGMQQALYPYNSPDQLPIKPVRLPNGEWLRIPLSFPGWKLWLRTWEVKIGKVKLYLLDSNDTANYPPYRAITSELYGGTSELRLQQEIVLGIGGTKLLEVLGLNPEVYHLNEGHAAFAILERCRQYQEKTNASFELALNLTRSGNLFTTHTAVPAGFDRFDPALLQTYLKYYAEEELKIPFDELLKLGRIDGQNPQEPFNMAYLAVRGSGAVSAVSLVHEEVSKELFSPLFPRWPKNEVPIGHVTNGVHMRSWDSEISDAFWTDVCCKDRWLGDDVEFTSKIRAAPDEKVWKMRQDSRKKMIEFGRNQTSLLLEARGMDPQNVERAKHYFKEDVLTIGFARRFATYKRPNMLLKDKERLFRILTNPTRRVQLIIAGKAHPKDLEGQKLIQEWMHFIQRPEVRESVVFISDYNVSVTEHLVGGVDLWINTPRHPWEACGTSGMKVLVNGGLNLSELDGWWKEAYSPEVGWAIGDKELSDDEEANVLYDLLENEIIPKFYDRDDQGIPRAWISLVKESMARLTYRFSTNRSISDYLEKYYLPLAANFRKRSENDASLTKEISIWKANWNLHGPHVRITNVQHEEQNGELLFTTDVDFGKLPKESARVELFANNETPIQMEENEGKWRAAIKTKRPPIDFSVRVIPYFPELNTPLENPFIIWS